MVLLADVAKRLDTVEDCYETLARTHQRPPGIRAATRKDTNLVYGETPAWALLELLDWAGITTTDVFYDLGSGRGRAVHLAALFCARCIGLEMLEHRHAAALRAASTLRFANVTLQQQDACEADFSDGTLFFSYWPTWRAETRLRAAQRIAQAAPGARGVTLGYPLEHPCVEVVAQRTQFLSLPTDEDGGTTRVTAFLSRVRDG